MVKRAIKKLKNNVSDRQTDGHVTTAYTALNVKHTENKIT